MNTPPHPDLCTLSLIWNEFAPGRVLESTERRVNEWLKKQIEAASPVRCTDCKVEAGGQHRPSCHRQGVVTAASDYRDKCTDGDAHLCLAGRGGCNLDDLKRVCLCGCHQQATDKPLKTIVASLEGAKFDVYGTHVHRFVMDFSNGPGGEWRYEETFTIPSYGVCDSNLTAGINESDRQEILTAIAEAQRG